MTTKAINDFRIVTIIEKLGQTPKVLLESQSLNKQIEVPGTVLEAQYRIGEKFLILVTEGNPFEEALYVYYLNNALQILDSLELSARYTEGMVRNLSISNLGDIHFSFFDANEQWILKVYSKPKYAFFNNKYPVKRKMPLHDKSLLSLRKS